jgi:hypothetical protein
MLSLKKIILQAGAEFSRTRKHFLGFIHKTQMGLADLPSLLFVVLSDTSEHLGFHLSTG